MDIKMMFILMLFIHALNTGLVAGLIYTGEQDKVVNGTLFQAVTARSAITCCAICSQNEQLCKVVNFNKGTGECQMVSTPPSADDTIDRPGWTMYSYSEGSCGDDYDWIKYGSSCYALIHLDYMHSWDECQFKCRDPSIGASMWFIHDPGEYEFIYNSTLQLAPTIFPIDLTNTLDEATGCMSEQVRTVFPSNPSICGMENASECAFFVGGNFERHSCNRSKTRTCLCEKRQTY